MHSDKLYNFLIYSFHRFHINSSPTLFLMMASCNQTSRIIVGPTWPKWGNGGCCGFQIVWNYRIYFRQRLLIEFRNNEISHTRTELINFVTVVPIVHVASSKNELWLTADLQTTDLSRKTSLITIDILH
jgi:hypothetical protein